jgi:hypothetical protein
VARSISLACPDALSVGSRGWSQVWLPITIPVTSSDRTYAGRTEALTPMLKNVAGIPYRCRIDRIAGVVTPGPSSKVSATVLPAPGAVRCTPDGAAGQPVLGPAAASDRGATPAGGRARISSGGQGPSGSGVLVAVGAGAGDGAADGAACAGPARASSTPASEPSTTVARTRRDDKAHLHAGRGARDAPRRSGSVPGTIPPRTGACPASPLPRRLASLRPMTDRVRADRGLLPVPVRE